MKLSNENSDLDMCWSDEFPYAFGQPFFLLLLNPSDALLGINGSIVLKTGPNLTHLSAGQSHQILIRKAGSVLFGMM